MPKPKITVALLKEKHACLAQVKMFRKLGGGRVKHTEELCVKWSKRLNFAWAAHHLLSPLQYNKYERLYFQFWKDGDSYEPHKAKAFFRVYYGKPR